MTINGKIGTIARDDERAQDPGHPPVIQAGKLKANDGVYPTGLLLTRKSDGKLEPVQVVTSEVLATGDGNTKAYSGFLAAGLPIEPGSLTISDGVEAFTDDGQGGLIGDAGGTGTINYKSTAYTASFNANVVLATEVVGGYQTVMDGVLDEETDTDEVEAGLYIAHGTVRRDVLKIGKTTKTAPTVSQLAVLARRGIWAV